MTKVSYLWCAKASDSSAISGIRYSQASCKVPPSMRRPKWSLNRVFTYRDLLTILSSESDCVVLARNSSVSKKLNNHIFSENEALL